MSVENHRDKRALVGKRRAHGILVYVDGQPVGWCQFGPSDELPIIDNIGRDPNPASQAKAEKLWKITCFVVDKKYRRRGVASAALRAALEAIRRKGGGLVHAYPVDRWVSSSWMWAGTVSMFEREGFEAVGPLGRNNVVMRRRV